MSHSSARTTRLDLPEPASDRPLWQITFRPEPGVDGERALRALLKRALRSHGMKAVRITPVAQDAADARPDQQREVKP